MSLYLETHIAYLLKHRSITILLFSEATHLNDWQLKSGLSQILRKQQKLLKIILQDGAHEKKWQPDVRLEEVSMLYFGILTILNIEMVLNPGVIDGLHFSHQMEELLRRILTAE